MISISAQHPLRCLERRLDESRNFLEIYRVTDVLKVDMPGPDDDILTFDDFVLDLRRGCLRCGEGEIGLRPKSFAMLRLLIENAGRLLAKDELTAVVWPGVAVTDESLARCISDVRRALGDSRRQRFIKTVPKRGYLFAAAVSHTIEPVRATPTASAELPRPHLSTPNKPSIAVLPFADLSVDQQQGYFADGMVEEITTALSRIKWLLVIARNSSFTYKGKPIDVRQVGRDLGVRYVLEGSIRKAGRQIRITVQLIDAVTGGHLWADVRNCDLRDVFALQDRVAADVAGQIEPRLRGTEIERASRKEPQKLDAYDLYLRALGEFHEHTQEGTRAAIRLLRRTLQIDASYAPAAALLCECRVTARLNAWDILSQEEISETIELALNAIRLGRDDPDVLWMGAISLAHFDQRHDEAADALERAVSLNPNSAAAWNASGWVSLNKDQPVHAVKAFRHALRLSPLDPMRGYFTCGLAMAEFVTGNNEEAVAWARKSVNEMPRYLSAIRILVAACADLGRTDEARTWLGRLLRIQPDLCVQTLRASVAAYPPTAQKLLEKGFRKAGLC